MTKTEQMKELYLDIMNKAYEVNNSETEEYEDIEIEVLMRYVSKVMEGDYNVFDYLTKLEKFGEDN